MSYDVGVCAGLEALQQQLVEEKDMKVQVLVANTNGQLARVVATHNKICLLDVCPHC